MYTMNKLRTRILNILMIIILFACTGQEISLIKKQGEEVIKFRAVSFDIADVKLLDGPFKHATLLNEKIL